MSLSEKDIKKLWGRSANRCAFLECRKILTQDSEGVTAAYTLGEQAHIVGEWPKNVGIPKGPRAKSTLTRDERETYSNYILLCPTHHKEVDNDEKVYTVERLHLMKATHEQWVEETLSSVVDLRRQATEQVYAVLIDAAVEGCQLSTWSVWTSYALKQPPEWDAEAFDRVAEFRRKVFAAVWPGSLPLLERAIHTLALAMTQAIETFSEHSEFNGKIYKGIRFYKAKEFNPRYNEQLKHYNDWLDEYAQSIFELGNAANWFAEVVRKDINPLFFVEHGKFVLRHGPYEPDMSFRTSLCEYTDEQKQDLPASLQHKIEQRQVARQRQEDAIVGRRLPPRPTVP